MSGLGIQMGLRSLLANQFALDTIGHNIANANTEGYSRQRMSMVGARPLMRGGNLIGTGVDAQDVQRTVDSLLLRRINRQVSVTGRLEAQLTGMQEAESLFGEPDGLGLSGLMDSFFQSVSGLASAPGDSILRTGMAQAAVEMTSQFNALTGGLGALGNDLAAGVDAHVANVNLLASNIAGLNKEIASLEASGLQANDLRDSRDVALKDLANLVDVQTQEGHDGSLVVCVAGNMLVSPTKSYAMSTTTDTNGDVALQVNGAAGLVPVTGGAIGGLLRVAQEFTPAVQSDLDLIARNMILEFNRAHSTGIPSSGPFSLLKSENQLVDLDQDGDFTDQLLANSGLPFDIEDGELYVSMTDELTGAVTKHKLDISVESTSVADLLQDLNDIPHLSAGLDSMGRLSLIADADHGFDFSSRLKTPADAAGSFGGGQATFSSGEGPFALVQGDTLNLTTQPSGTPVAISFDSADFANMGIATADEIAAVINADAGASAAGLTATAADGRLVLQTAGSGAAEGVTLDPSTAAASLGMAAMVGTTTFGSDLPVTVQLSGPYSGANNDKYTFVPVGDGTIGTTPGLVVEVYDEAGQLVSSLSVGDNYQPGQPLAVAEGISVSFGLGEISGSAGDFFAADVVADGDTSDVLVAMGLNSFLTGTSASDIAVREDIVLDNSLIATSSSGSQGDNGALLSLLSVQNKDSSELGNLSVAESYGTLVGEVGFEVSSASTALQVGATLQISLEQRRESVSGVNVDEELVDLMRYEQAFQAASEYISIINRLNDELLSIL